MEWTLDDVVLAELASDFRIALDGQRCAWVKSSGDPEKDERVSHLMLSSLTERRDTQLTRGPDSCVTPRWSPDGEWLAFCTTRRPPSAKPPPPDDEPQSQIWLLPAGGGEPWPLTEMSRGVRAFDWAGAGSLVFAAQEDRSLYEITHKERKEKTRVVEDEAH